jgi:hypothetical protein
LCCAPSTSAAPEAFIACAAGVALEAVVVDWSHCSWCELLADRLAIYGIVAVPTVYQARLGNQLFPGNANVSC